MTDSNKGKELDELNNAKNKDLDNQSKPDLIADGSGIKKIDEGGIKPVPGSMSAPTINTSAPGSVGGIGGGRGLGPGSAGQVVTPRTIPTPQPTSLPQTGAGGMIIMPGGGRVNTQSTSTTTPTPKAEISLPTTLPRNIQYVPDPPTTPIDAPLYPNGVPKLRDPFKDLLNPKTTPIKTSPPKPGNVRVPRRVIETPKKDPGFLKNPIRLNPAKPRPEIQEAPGIEINPNDFGRTPADQVKVPRQKTRGSSTRPSDKVTSRRSKTGQPNRPGKAKTKTPSSTNEQRIADKYTNRKYDSLTQAEKDELKKDYVWSPDSGRPTLRRKSATSNTPELHLDPNGVIRKGLAPSNNRLPSSSHKMAKNFRETYGEDVPKGDNNHHGISVGVYKRDPLCQAADKAEATEVDRGLIAAPSNSNSYHNEDTNRTAQEQAAVDRLNANGGRVDELAHSGSHGNLDKRAEKLLDKEADRLREKYGTEDLNKVPSHELKNSVEKVRQELLQKLRDANRIIKGVKAGTLSRSELKKIPDYIRRYDNLQDNKGNPPQPGNRKEVWRITKNLTGGQLKNNPEVASSLKEKANQPLTVTYLTRDIPKDIMTKPLTADRVAYFNAYCAKVIAKRRDSMTTVTQEFKRTKSGTVEIYDLPNRTLNTVIDPSKGTITAVKPTEQQANLLEGQRKGILNTYNNLAATSQKSAPDTNMRRGLSL